MNRQIYALTLGPQNIEPMDQKMSRKRVCLNYKQYKYIICENGDILLQIMMVVEQCPTVADNMATPLAENISLAANDCGYGSTLEELIVNYAHLFF